MLKKHPLHQDNPKLSALLLHLEQLLKPIQKEIEKNEKPKPELPIICIVGTSRSGTTLLLQTLASVDGLAYPSNFLTRFAYAPYIGAILEQLLFDAESDFHGDFSDLHDFFNLNKQMSKDPTLYSSDLGKTKGLLAPNEFQHFFRHYLPKTVIECLTTQELEQVNIDGMLRGLASIEMVKKKPFVTKATLIAQNILYFAKHLDTAIFLYIHREPADIMCSLLAARRRMFGNETGWIGRHPPEYVWLKDENTYTQIAGQVFFIQQNIEKSLHDLPANRHLSITYKQLCSNPLEIVKKVEEACAAMGYISKFTYNGPANFQLSDKPKDPSELKSLLDAYENIRQRFS